MAAKKAGRSPKVTKDGFAHFEVSQDESSLYAPRFHAKWSKIALWDTAEWTNGLAFREFSFTANGLPIIKIGELKNGVSSATRRTLSQFEKKYLVESGDVLYSWSGSPETSLDVFTWRGEAGWLNQHIFKIDHHSCVTKGFLIQLLRYLRPNLVAIATNKQTTGLGHVTQQDLRRVVVSLPPLPEQRSIAHILGTLDDKIELNRRTNETLEAMARALFKSWFVDFDPVHAKKAGRKPEGMDAETAALFPDDFEDSEMGKIPRGWRVTRVDALAEAGVLSVGDGYRAKNSELSPFGSLPFARAGNVNNGFSFDDADHVSPEAVGRLGDKVSRPFDVVFTSKGTVGRFGFVGPHTSTFAYSPQLCFWRSTNQGELDSFYLYEWMQSRYFGEQVDRVKGQTDMAEYVSLRDQRRMVLMIPRTPVQASFAVVASAFHRQVWATVEETRTLAALRDALLPQLLSGSLRVPEAMRLVEKAL